jgi:hypothetical protein
VHWPDVVCQVAVSGFLGRAKERFVMSSKVINKSKCAPKIYRKLSLQQQILWDALYKVFNDTMNFPPLPKNQKYDQSHIEVTAHNMACQAVWELARQKIVVDRKPAHNSAMDVIPLAELEGILGGHFNDLIIGVAETKSVFKSIVETCRKRAELHQ